MGSLKPRKPGGVSERPLWLIGLMYAFHTAWLAFCALWIPTTYGEAIMRRFGTPLAIFPAVIIVYALAPFVASFSELGREYWELVGRGGTARQATLKILIFGALFVMLVAGMHVFLT